MKCYITGFILIYMDILYIPLVYQRQVGYFNGVLKYLLEHLNHKNISCIIQALSRK